MESRAWDGTEPWSMERELRVFLRVPDVMWVHCVVRMGLLHACMAYWLLRLEGVRACHGREQSVLR